MPFSVICHGCGKSLEVPDDYPRRKMRCVECGVICEIPAPGKERTAASAAPTKPQRAKPQAEPPELVPIPFQETAPPPLIPDMELGFSDEDDGKPYAVTGGLPKPCPNCNKPLEPRARLCVSCGYDFEAGKTPEKVYEPVEREWEPAMPFQRRLKYFVVCVIAFFFLGFLGTISSGKWLSFMLSWLTFSGMLAFLFGTYDRVNLTRNARGQVRLFHSWRFCFVQWTSARVPLKDYEGVVTNRVSEGTTTNWIIFGFLVLSGLLSALNIVIGALERDQISFLEWLGMLILMPLSFVPAAIAYYVFFCKISFYVALSDGHGFPAKYLYKGWSEEHMRDVAETVSKVTTMPYLRV